MMKTLKWIAVGLLVAVGVQAAIVTDNLTQELNADDIGAVTDGSTWTGTGVSASLNDTGAGLTKAAATVNGGYTSTVFTNTLTAGGYARAGHVGATTTYLTGTTLSVELWINTGFTGIPATSHTIFETGGATRGMSITLGDNGSGTNNTLRFAMKDASNSAYVDVTLDAAAMADFTDGHHHQLAVTYDNVNNMSVYIDGALVAENTSAGVVDWDGSSGLGFWGQDGSGNGAQALTLDDDLANTSINGKGQGSIAVFRQYSDVLTAAEVLQNYYATVPNYYVGSGALIDVVYNNTSPTIGSIDSTNSNSWSSGLPSDSNPGLFTNGTAALSSASAWYVWYGVAVRQTGGTLSQANHTMRGGAQDGSSFHSTLEIDDTSNTGSYTNLAVGKLAMWNQNAAAGATGNTLSLLNGYADVGEMAATSPNDEFVNILNGRLDVGYFSNARVTVNMLDGGTGAFNLDDMYGDSADPDHKSKLKNLILNFESGSEASFSIASSNVTGSAVGAWETKIAAGQVKIDGVAVTGLGAFTIEDVGALGTKISLNSYWSTSTIFTATGGSVLEIVYDAPPNRGVILSGNTGDWSNGLPTNGNPGLVVGGTHDFTDPDNGGMYGISIRQTGGQLTDANLDMRGGAAGTTNGTIITIDDASNDGSYTNLAIAGQFVMWNSNSGDGGYGNELSVLNGYATVGILNTTANPADIAMINILNGRFDVGALVSNKASCTVTMLAGGTGEINLADMTSTAAAMDKMILNFESGSEASFSILSNGVSSAQGTWETKIAAGTVKIDGVAVTDTNRFEIVDVGALGTKISADTTPPNPNPATFSSAPSAINTTISMTVTEGSDASGPVWYYFAETSGNPGGDDSGWQLSPTYTDSRLAPHTEYTYTVKMRDSATLPNVGAASEEASATTGPPQGMVFVIR
jgi:hypothetical protein